MGYPTLGSAWSSNKTARRHSPVHRRGAPLVQYLVWSQLQLTNCDVGGFGAPSSPKPGRLDVKAGGVSVNIYPTVAKKFSSEENQTKYEHLNVEFSQGISQDAKGIFAELAGVRKMSEATAELLRQPPKAERGPKA